MKTNLASLVRFTALATALLALPVFASAKDSATDRAAEVLRATGRLPVQSAGPYVEVGTFKIQVAVKLGRATTTLPDGTWLYDHFVSDHSAATGTLVVRFTHGRVSDMSLVTPAIATAMRAPKKFADDSLVARRD